MPTQKSAPPRGGPGVAGEAVKVSAAMERNTAANAHMPPPQRPPVAAAHLGSAHARPVPPLSPRASSSPPLRRGRNLPALTPCVPALHLSALHPHPNGFPGPSSISPAPPHHLSYTASLCGAVSHIDVDGRPVVSVSRILLGLFPMRVVVVVVCSWRAVLARH